MPVHWTISHPSRLVIAVAKDDVKVQDIEQYLAHLALLSANRIRAHAELA